jgi:hypothetical protein
MKEKMNIVLANGYVFNKDTQKLESFTIKCVKANFTRGIVAYDCVLGGEDTTIVNDDLKVYYTDHHFERGKFVDASSLSNFDSLFYRTFDCSCHKVDGVHMTWIFKDGAAEFTSVPEINFSIEMSNGAVESVKADVDIRFYETREAVYAHNDYIVKEADGSMIVHKSPATLLSLNDEQMKSVENIRAEIKKLIDSGVRLFFDQEDWRLRAVSATHLDKIEPWDDYDSEYMCIQDFTTIICDSGYIKGSDISSYDLKAKFKDGVRVQKLQ